MSFKVQIMSAPHLDMRTAIAGGISGLWYRFDRACWALPRRKTRTSPLERSDDTSSVVTKWQTAANDATGTIAGVEKQTSIFHWENVTYSVEIKGEECGLTRTGDTL
jgi:hypothetical protein